MYRSRILVIILINQATKFIPSIGTVIYYRSPRGIVKAIRFLLSILSSNQLQLEKKSTRDITLHPANSSENLSVYSGRFASLIVTRLIFIAVLISQYFLYSFLLIRNYRFLYRLSQYSRTSRASRSYNIFITSPYRAFSIGKLSAYYALYGTVLIFSSRVTSLLTRPILENSYTRASS